MSEKIVQLNEEVIKGEIRELVRGSVEETLNGLLEAEAQKLTQAARYERSEERQAYRSGHYQMCIRDRYPHVSLADGISLRPPTEAGNHRAHNMAAAVNIGYHAVRPLRMPAGVIWGGPEIPGRMLPIKVGVLCRMPDGEAFKNNVPRSAIGHRQLRRRGIRPVSYTHLLPLPKSKINTNRIHGASPSPFFRLRYNTAAYRRALEGAAVL